MTDHSILPMSNDYTLSVAHQALIDTITANTYEASTISMDTNIIRSYDAASISNLDTDYIKIQGYDVTDILKKLAREAEENTELEEEYPELKELKLRYEKLLAEIKLERLITK